MYNIFKRRFIFLCIYRHLQIANGEDEISTLNPQQGSFTFLPVTLTRDIHFLLAKQRKTANKSSSHTFNFPDE